METKVILITGASSGVGRITAEMLAESHIIYASMRAIDGKNADKAQNMQQQECLLLAIVAPYH